MTYANSAEIVDAFWDAVWQSRNPEAVDDFVVEDFVLTNAGEPIVGRANFKEWVRAFLARVDDFEFQVLETFQNADGSRVASRWQITGRNNGVLGTEPDGQPISFTGTAVWAIRADGKLLHNWVERASWELHQRLIQRAA
jgi:predicted ester cyclase